jgi:gamma-glutamylcyclotransferase (GGCT)/AIG2-like uncharacterized protein YtfP
MQYAAIMIDSRLDERGAAELMQLVDTANAARRRSRTTGGERNHQSDAEDRLESLYGTSERLAVYGSLAPRRQNHHMVAPLGGTWAEGVVEGYLVTYGWGAAIGFPALTLRPGDPAVAVHVLTSAALRSAWSDLDAFEGAEYRRVLVPVWSATEPRTLLTVANLYEGAAPIDQPLDIRAAD